MGDKHGRVVGMMQKASPEERARTGMSIVVAVFGYLAGKAGAEEIDKEFFDDSCDEDSIFDFCGDVGSSWGDSHGLHSIDVELMDVSARIDLMVEVPAIGVALLAGALTYMALNRKRSNGYGAGLAYG